MWGDIEEEDLRDIKLVMYQKSVGGLTYEQVENENVAWVEFYSTVDQLIQERQSKAYDGK